MPSPISVQSRPLPLPDTWTTGAGLIGCGFTGHVGGPGSVRRVPESTGVAPGASTCLP